MKTYKFNADTKEYLYFEEAFLDPLETEQQGQQVWLLPADSTFAKPLEAKPGHTVCWNGSKWEYKEDHRQTRDKGGVIVEGSGTAYWMPEDTWESPARYMTELGPLPKGAVLVRPNKPKELVRKEALSRIDSATSATILAGFEYTIDNETLHFSYDSFDQQNFADTANGALLALQNIEGVPTSVTWNGYRNHTKEQKGELVRLVLDVTKFLDLYVKGALAHKDTQMELGGKRKAIISNCTTVESIKMYMKSWYGE